MPKTAKKSVLQTPPTGGGLWSGPPVQTLPSLSSSAEQTGAPSYLSARRERLQTSILHGGPSSSNGGKSAMEANAYHTPNWVVVVASLNWCLRWLEKWELIEVRGDQGLACVISFRASDGWSFEPRLGLVLKERE